MDAVCFQVKTSISFLGQAGVKGCCEVSHLLCHPLGVYLIDDRKVTRAATPCWGFLPGDYTKQ